MQVSRRSLFAAACAALADPARAAIRPLIRIGLLQFGTIQWITDVIQRHGLDAAHDFALAPVPLANIDAGRIAIMASQADIIVSDWPFVALQRGAGTKLCFSPFSTATGAIMVKPDSPIQALVDLKGRRLGIAGGPVDKSWLVVQAAARANNHLDLARDAQLVYGAPPLLGAKLEQGELDAVLTFWNFAAKLETQGFRQAISVADCAASLGLPPLLDLVGFVFREAWADTGPAIDGFLAAAAEARHILATSDAEWAAIRPLMGDPDDALFARLKARFIEGATKPDAPDQQATAEHLFALLQRTGGTRATGGLETLPPGIFWHHGPA